MQKVIFALLILASPVLAFGNGAHTFDEFTIPGGIDAPEPTLGINWNTDNVMYHAYATTFRAEFEGDNITWTDVTPPYQVPINLDPMLHTDPDTGRTWAGGLLGPCSVMFVTDDDGALWTPLSLNMCSGAWFDHQSIGSGPHPIIPNGPPLKHSVYYCGQLGQIGCSASHDGGTTWTAPTPHMGDCGGFHGHIRVSRATGFVAVPVAGCGSMHGLMGSSNGGLTYESYTIPDSHRWTNGFDPSIQFSRESGWMWYGMASERGIHVSLSKDDGASWEQIGPSQNKTWLDIGQFADPPVIAGTFADVQTGDDDRIAMTFIGIEDNGTVNKEIVNSNQIYACDQFQEELVWYYYAAFSYDAGSNWTVVKMSEDPVQVGGVYDSVVNSGGSCRNLLDFNDMDVDSTGRIYVAWADGCTADCETEKRPGVDGYRTQVGKMFRQTGGRGVFAEFDLPEVPVISDLDEDGIPDDEDDDIDGDGVPNDEDEDPESFNTIDQPKEASGFGVLAALGALGAVVLARRKQE